MKRVNSEPQETTDFARSSKDNIFAAMGTCFSEPIRIGVKAGETIVTDLSKWEDEVAIRNLALALRGKAIFKQYDEEVREVIKVTLMNPQIIEPLKKGELFVSPDYKEESEGETKKRKNDGKMKFEIEDPDHKRKVERLFNDEVCREQLAKKHREDPNYIAATYGDEIGPLLRIALENEDVGEAFKQGEPYNGKVDVAAAIQRKPSVLTEKGRVRASESARAKVKMILESKSDFEAISKTEEIRGMSDQTIARITRASVANLTKPYIYKEEKRQDEVNNEDAKTLQTFAEYHLEAVFFGMADHEVSHVLGRMKKDEDISNLEDFFKRNPACFPAALYAVGLKDHGAEYTKHIKIRLVINLLLKKRFEEAGRYFQTWQLHDAEENILDSVAGRIKNNPLEIRFPKLEAIMRWIENGAEGGLRGLLQRLYQAGQKEIHGKPFIEEKQRLRLMLHHRFTPKGA